MVPLVLMLASMDFMNPMAFGDGFGRGFLRVSLIPLCGFEGFFYCSGMLSLALRSMGLGILMVV